MGFKNKKKDKKHDDGLTKLHTAKTAHHVQKYLEREMSPDDLSREGDAPIHYYIKRKDQNRLECLMAFLIHTPRNDIIDLVNSDGMTALHLACERNDLFATKVLICFDADLNLINYDNCTPLDIAAGWYRSIAELPRLLVDLGGMRAQDIKQFQRQESEDYEEGGYRENPMASFFEEERSEPERHEERTIRTRFGLDMQLMSMRSLDDPPSHEMIPAEYFGGGLEFHDARDQGGEGLESLPEENEAPRSLAVSKTGSHFPTPEASIEMALTEASVILAKEKKLQNDTPDSSVVSGTSLLEKNKFLSPSVSPLNVESPIEESTEEVEPTPPAVTPEDRTRAYTHMISSNTTSENSYQPVTNPMSLEHTDEGEEWVKVKGNSKPHVHFASPEPVDDEDKALSSYIMVNGTKYKQFKEATVEKLERAIASSPPSDEGYAAWLQWREMMKAKKRKEEIRKHLELGDEHPDSPVPHKEPMDTAPPKPFTARRPNTGAPVQRKHNWRQRHYLRQHSSGGGSLNVLKSLINPSVAVHKSILGSSVAPFMIREEKGEKILCLDGGGIKGLIQIEILKHIELEAGKPIDELFDWVVGTSTGGVVALALVYAKRSLEDLKKMFFELKDQVFKRQSKLIPTACDTEALEALLKKTLGEDLKMSSVKKPKVLVTAVDKSTSDLPLRFFNNCFNDDYSTQPVWQVARYTSAAPLYFKEMDDFVDGGVVANNPCQYALARIQRYMREQMSSPYLKPSNPVKSKKPPKPKIGCVVSIGCGKFPPEPIGNTDILEAMKISKLHNAPQMLSNLVNLLTSTLSKSDDVAMLCQNSCEEQEIPFYRFSPELGETVGTAETDNMKLCDLIIGAKKLLVDSREHIEKLIGHLKDPDDF